MIAMLVIQIMGRLHLNISIVGVIGVDVGVLETLVLEQ